MLKLLLLTQLPLHRAYPAEHEQLPPVQDSNGAQELPHRPQFWESVMKLPGSRQFPAHHCCPTEQLDPEGADVLAGGLTGGFF